AAASQSPATTSTPTARSVSATYVRCAFANIGSGAGCRPRYVTEFKFGSVAGPDPGPPPLPPSAIHDEAVPAGFSTTNAFGTSPASSSALPTTADDVNGR